MEKQSIRGKRRARKFALQALYQWLMSGTDLHEIEAQFRTINNMDKVDGEYFCRLLYGIPTHVEALEASLLPYLDREINALNPIELTVLRIGSFELFHCPEIPYKVILDESVSLTKEFGSQEGYRYVNGVLNNLAKQVRSVEVSLGNE
ncbi:transcription antitermination factor NusB [Legionella pneumophila serogroup 1]|uniref:transcription antitermination factor NusB n=1 Tax=Legionella pneumophila TaxID=446 RepID=UPI0004839C36|nr:transcription antitermination factor NusB [Legionella pneumophila]MCH9061241.1 transcription antitermination factor NusB [Legionella pneumophila serogroup 1]MCH9063762.1 transcription antitermination factor NusB [Legionella pneumophila serogroup 1]MCH9067142.1 transcription antitermination factor NusB [Legionella pneumophila serogroup 1]MCH9070225.1 transcription antitermination factor NusB [Legionella pneumophila serogroup 1]MCH9073251.1 transcription antitermination factor NusB [Legionell